MRTTVKRLFVLLLVVFAFASVGESAQRTAQHGVRHRARHSSRVVTGSKPAKKKVTKSKRRVHRRPSATGKGKATTRHR